MPVLRILAILTGLLVMTADLAAVEPDEVLENPVLEERARDLSVKLRCMVCQNQSIDDSDADLARDLRLLVRERLVEGDTDAQVLDYVVSRYGEFVLLQPRLSARNLLLWLAAPAILLIGAAGFGLYARRSAGSRSQASLSAEEQRRIAKILDEGD